MWERARPEECEVVVVDEEERALRREMGETLARVEGAPGKEPGTGNIRGIGAEKWFGGKEGEAGRVDCEFALFLFSCALTVGFLGLRDGGELTCGSVSRLGEISGPHDAERFRHADYHAAGGGEGEREKRPRTEAIYSRLEAV